MVFMVQLTTSATGGGTKVSAEHPTGIACAKAELLCASVLVIRRHVCTVAWQTTNAGLSAYNQGKSGAATSNSFHANKK